ACYAVRGSVPMPEVRVRMDREHAIRSKQAVRRPSWKSRRTAEGAAEASHSRPHGVDHAVEMVSEDQAVVEPAHRPQVIVVAAVLARATGQNAAGAVAETGGGEFVAPGGKDEAVAIQAYQSQARGAERRVQDAVRSQPQEAHVGRRVIDVAAAGAAPDH